MTGPQWLIPSWLAALLTVDLAIHHLALMLVVATACISAGALATLPGKLGLILGLVAAAGLIWIWLPAPTAFATTAETARAMDLDDAAPVPRWLILVPFQRARREVAVTRDVEFFRAAGRVIELDVYQIPSAAKLRPALIYLHGGGWVFGDKRTQGLPLCNHLAANGWVCFNANYRLSPGATYPDQVVDCKAAIAWVREHAAEYGVDTGFIALAGGSAGAHIAAMAALTVRSESLQPGFEQADASVQAVVTNYGVYDLTNRLGLHHPEFFSRLIGPLVIKAFPDTQAERFSAASPLDHAERGTMPWLIIHGEFDSLAPPQEARDFAAALREAGNTRVGYAELPAGLHGFDLWYSHRAIAATELTTRFLNTTYRRAAEAAPRET